MLARRIFMETIFLNIEKLKKEVWAISKKKIPALEAQIEGLGGVDVSELTATLQAQQTVLNNLSSSLDTLSASQSESQTKITALEGKTEKHDTDIATLTSSLKETNKTLDELSAVIASHTSSINTLSTSVANNTSAISTNATNISTNATNISANATNISANTDAISSLQTTLNSQSTTLTTFQDQLDTLSSNVSSNTSSLVTLTESLTALTTRVDNLENQTNSLTDSITTINGEITTLETDVNAASATANNALSLAQNLKTRVDNLNVSGGTGGESSTACLSGVVLYDMRSTDASVNRGYTTGIQNRQKVTIDFTPYRYLKIFTVFGNAYEDQLFIDIRNKKAFTFTSHAWMSNYFLAFMRIRIPTALNFIMMENYGKVAFDGSGLPITLADEAEVSKFIIFRIEGIA